MSGFMLLDGIRSRIMRSVPSTIRHLRSRSSSSCESDDPAGYITAANSGLSTPTSVIDGGALALTAINPEVLATISSQRSHDRIPSCSEDDIDWATIELGIHLSQYALECHRMNPEYDPVLLRNVLEDGVKYIKTGLSQDQSADTQLECQRKPYDQRSLIRSYTASVVCCMIGLFMLFLPILASLMSWALEFDRRHHITERATTQAVSTASNAGLQLGNLLLRINQSEMGGQAAHLLRDILEGARDGVNDYTIKIHPRGDKSLRDDAVI